MRFPIFPLALVLLAAAPAAAQVDAERRPAPASPRLEVSVQATRFVPDFTTREVDPALEGITLRGGYRAASAGTRVELFVSHVPREGERPGMDALGLGFNRPVLTSRGGSAAFVTLGLGAFRRGEKRDVDPATCPESALSLCARHFWVEQVEPSVNLGLGGRVEVVRHLGVRADLRGHTQASDGALVTFPPRMELAVGASASF